MWHFFKGNELKFKSLCVSEKTLHSQKTKTWDTGLTTWELCICIAVSPMPNWSLVQEFLTSPPKSFCVHGNSLQLFYMAGLGTRLVMRVVLVLGLGCCIMLSCSITWLLVVSLVLSFDFLSLKLGAGYFV